VFGSDTTHHREGIGCHLQLIGGKITSIGTMGPTLLEWPCN